MKTTVFPLLALLLGLCSASPLALLSPFEGSADEDHLFNSTSPLAPTRLSPDPPSPTAPAVAPRVNADALKRVEDFLRENTLLILVAITLVFLIFLVLCGAFFMSRKRKVNAYYPSSFPSKMYVDHRDKTGGAKLFSDLPEKASVAQDSDPLDSHRQLQADIVRAARSLRAPHRSAGQAEDQGAEGDVQRPRDSVLDVLLPSLPEEKEPCQLSIREAVSSEESLSGKSESQEVLLGRSARPSSLHVLSDTATLQLIAGDNTAF
ncbi:transmembrane protein 119b [Eucyclogobius newberryi]|uniref:transmembrane protein 119b n=1 Tax=Eucyclogobius newberryi TaxID=166745 RepID=UPI003B5ACDC6